MSRQVERLFARLSAAERMAVLVGLLTTAAMVSAVAADRLFQSQPSPVVITVDALDAPRISAAGIANKE
jgi:hypothetical protein